MLLGNSKGGKNGNGASDEHLENANEQLVSNLSSKISQLKSIAVDIESEAKYQNKYQLSSVQDDFDSLKQYMGSSFNRVSNMISSGGSNRRLMCYLIVFLVCLFFICYYALGRLSR